MKLLSKYFAFIFLFTVFTNCTIQKRTVNKGYFVRWNFSKKLKKINISKGEQDSVLTVNNNFQFSDSTKVNNEISNVNDGKMSINAESISKIEKKEKYLKTLVENKIKPKKNFSASMIKLIELNNSSSTKYYNKSKGKKAGKYLLISSLSFLVMILALGLALFSNLNAPEWFYDIFLQALMFIGILLFLVFGILAVVLFISAFFKPNEKTTSSK